MQRLSKNTFVSSLVIFFVIYSCTLVVLAKKTVTWEDELYTLHTTAHDVKFAINQSYYFEGQPPVYFVLLNLWRNISDSLFFARLFSIVFALLSGIIAYKICRIFLYQDLSTLTTILFLLNPYFIALSFDARLYSLLIFLSAFSIYLFYKTYLTKSTTKFYRGLHTVISILGVFTQYLFVFLLIAQAIIVFQRKDWRKFFIFFTIHFSLALIFLINLKFFREQIEPASNQVLVNIEYFKDFFRTIQNYLFSFNNYHFSTITRLGIFLLYFVWLLFFIKKQNFSLTSVYKIIQPVFFLFTITLLVLLSIIVLFSTNKLVYTDRYMTILFPPLLLFFIFSLTINNKKRFIFWFILLFLYYTFIDFNTYACFVKTLDFERIAEFIENDQKSDEPLLFYKSTYSISFQHYYNGNREIVQLPVPMEYNINYIKNMWINDTATLNKIFNKDLRFEKEFTLLTDNIDKLYGRKIKHEMIDNYINTNFYIKSDTFIMGRAKNYGLRVRKLIRKE